MTKPAERTLPLVAQSPYSAQRLPAWQDSQFAVVVVGLGITGLSVLRCLLAQGAMNIKVMDTRQQPPNVDFLQAHADRITYHCGSWQSDWLMQADLIVLSPGIDVRNTPVEQAYLAGRAVVGDIELFAWLNRKPVIGITGSNGKSTVTDLMQHMLRAAQLRATAGGNIGLPALDLLEHDLDWVVLELSSFQLELTAQLPLSAALFLNFAADHLDRHGEMRHYLAAKQRIFMQAQHALYNPLDTATNPAPAHDKLQPTPFLGEQANWSIQQTKQGYVLRDGTGEYADIFINDLALIGLHNVHNILAVLNTLSVLKLPIVPKALCEYSGLPHRCQTVVNQYDIRWINDSKATNVASTQAALKGLNCPATIHLLLGGDAKGADVTELLDTLAQVKSVRLYCYGRDGAAFTKLSKEAQLFGTLQDALQKVTTQLQKGDWVLLSPACASWDQFKNYQQRGEHFALFAQQWADQQCNR